MSEKKFSKCGMRCDLCLVYRPNVEKEDRREEMCRVWKKIWPGFEADAKSIYCDGCFCEAEDAVLFSPGCETRECVMVKGLEHCGYCENYPCDIFPAEPTQEELVQKIDVEKQWTWEEEKLMEAYRCKQFMDEFRNSKEAPMENKIEVKQLSNHIYAMNDLGSTGYLVLGNEKALMIDTMNGSEDLKAVVRTITDMPVMVVNTHGHVDHICGNIFFEEAYIHPADIALAKEHSSFPDFIETISRLGLSMPPFKELQDGTVLDLGGATLDVLHLPGHTGGGICLLYREERVLFTGDGINCHLWMQLDHSLQMKELKKSLENISWIKEKADRILHGHTMDYIGISLIDELYQGVCDLVEHPELSETDPDYNWFGGVAKKHMFGEEKAICYVPEKLK